jgi:hypothetical protein
MQGTKRQKAKRHVNKNDPAQTNAEKGEITPKADSENGKELPSIRATLHLCTAASSQDSTNTYGQLA